MDFFKLQALGNDFVLLDNSPFPDTETIIKMADRHLGIGFDQLIWVKQIALDQFELRFANADGSEVGQCGNGACACALFLFNKHPKLESIVLNTSAISMQAQRHLQGIALSLPSPDFNPSSLPMITKNSSPEQVINIDNNKITIMTCYLGNPHAVVRVDNVNTDNIDKLGPMLSEHPCFPKHCNIGFAQLISNKALKLRVYERGAGWTQACGSGACAAGAVAISQQWLESPATIEQPGGKCLIKWQPNQHLLLIGSANYVFSGSYTPD